jgi:hypothetical protein
MWIFDAEWHTHVGGAVSACDPKFGVSVGCGVYGMSAGGVPSPGVAYGSNVGDGVRLGCGVAGNVGATPGGVAGNTTRCARADGETAHTSAVTAQHSVASRRHCGPMPLKKKTPQQGTTVIKWDWLAVQRGKSARSKLTERACPI